MSQRLSSEHLCGHGAQSCDACTDSWSIRERALVEQRDALARGIAAMVADGLDIDDPGTAPVWTGKVLAKDGAVLFDLARQIDWRDTMAEAMRERDALRAEVARLKKLVEALRLQRDDADRSRERNWARVATVEAEVERLRAALPDDLRSSGWSVAVHNDYRINGVPMTFWLLTKGDRCIKGEGLTDSDALTAARAALAATKGGG
jgi:hypothetical protein